MPNPLSNEFPLRLGDPELFAQARHALSSAEFTEAKLCGILQLNALSELGRLKREAIDLRLVSKDLVALIQLFLLGESVARVDMERDFSRAHLEAFLGLDLLRSGPGDDATFWSPVFLYPVSGFLIASDRQTVPNGLVCGSRPLAAESTEAASRT